VQYRRINWKLVSIIGGSAIALFFIGGILLAGIDTPALPPATQPIVLKGGHVEGNRISTKSWSLDYAAAHMSPDGTSGTIDGVRNGIVYKDGKPYLKLSAEHVSFNTASLDFTAIGHVHVERDRPGDNQVFDTDLVVWTNGAKLLRLDHPSYIRSGGHMLKIDKVTVNFVTDEISIGRIGGTVELKK
jgi:hypothetical protein